MNNIILWIVARTFDYPVSDYQFPGRNHLENLPPHCSRNSADEIIILRNSSLSKCLPFVYNTNWAGIFSSAFLLEHLFKEISYV